MLKVKIIKETYLEAVKAVTASLPTLSLQMLSTLPLQSYIVTASFFQLGSC